LHLCDSTPIISSVSSAPPAPAAAGIESVRPVARHSIAQRKERFAVYGLLLLYLASAYGFAVATPYGEAPDEYGHFFYVEHLVRFGTLPEIIKYPYSYEAFQPPLYYLLGATMATVGRTVIRDDPSWGGRIAPPIFGNPRFYDENNRSVAAMLHPAHERWPFWPYALRALSIAMGLGVVLLTYATARALVPPPAPDVVPLLATTFAALIPQANFIRASISNGNLADLIGAWIIWLLVLHLTHPHESRRVGSLGVALGLGLLTKMNVAPLIVPVVLLIWLRRQGRNAGFVRDLALVLALVLALAGWFYIYRWIVYGDPLAFEAWKTMQPPNSTWQLTDFFWFDEGFRSAVWTSFWGLYGWGLIWLPDWIYNAFLGITFVALLGIIYLIARRALSKTQLICCGVFLSALLLLYAMIIQASLFQIAWQGRLLFPALSGVCILLGIGLGAVVLGRGAVQHVERMATWRRVAASGMVAATVIGLLALNIYSIIWLVIPALNSG
jgi:hypothetical protein